jgi:serine/threonine-protein kinase
VLDELVRVWNEGMTPEQLDAAIDATRGLPALEACSDLRGLTERAPLPADRQTVERIRSARAQVAVASALLLANRVKDAKREAETARRQADATGWPQVLAEAALVEARILDLQHDAAAKEPLQAALRAAFEARDDRLGAEVLLEQLYALDLANKSDEALRVSDLADAMILRLGDDARLRSQWLRRRAAVLITAGRYEEARALLTFAWVRAIALFGEEDGEAIDCLGELVRTVDSLANFPEARRLGERHLAATRRMFGEEHPRVVKSLTNLGTVALHAGNHEDAAGYYRRSLAIEENTVGPDAARTAGSLNNLGTVEMTMGHYDVARSLLERAQAIRERVQGPDHPYVAFALHNLGMIARKQGRLDDAFALLRRALAIKQKAYGPEHPSDASTHTQIGVTFTVMGRHEEALAEFRRVLEIRTKVLGAAHADTAWARRLVASSLIELGRYDEGCPLLDDKSPPDPDGHRAARQVELLGACELGRGRAAQAVLRLDEVREMRKDQSPSVDRGIAHWLHARALWAAGRKVDAIEAAKRALPELAVDAEGARDLAAVRAWLAARGAR